MREMTVSYVPTDSNTADMWTKILKRQPFEKHRNVALNKSAGDGLLANMGRKSESGDSAATDGAKA